MSSQGPKQLLYAQFAEVAKALGHGHRLEILELLAQGERSVEALASRAGLSLANASQHLRLMPRARNIPLRALARRLRELPKNREIVAYCRGPYCVLALEAAALLRRRGFTVRRLEDGFPEWQAAGLPVERGAAARR